MGASGSVGAYKKIRCLYCGSGQVEWWSFGPDCRGNPGSFEICCKKCKKRSRWISKPKPMKLDRRLTI